MWVESSYVQKTHTGRLRCFFRAVLKWCTHVALEGEESHFSPAMHIYSDRQRKALRTKNFGTEVRNYLLSQRTPASRGTRRRKDNPQSVPCWSDAIAGSSEVSRAEQQWVPPWLRKKGEEWAIGRRRRKEEGWEGNCSTAAAPCTFTKKHTPLGRTFLHRITQILCIQT